MAEELRWRGEDILLRANQHQPAVAAPEEERTAHTAAVRKMRQAVILAGDMVQRLRMAAAEGTRRQGRTADTLVKLLAETVTVRRLRQR